MKAGQYRHTSETPFQWRFADGTISAKTVCLLGKNSFYIICTRDRVFIDSCFAKSMFKVGLIKVMIVGQLTAQSIDLPICQLTRAKLN